MLKNILVTGGAGFIGSSIVLKLIEQGRNVTVLDNLSKQVHGKNLKNSILFQRIKDKVNFIYGSVLCREDVEKAINNQDCVVHLAAETGTGQSMYEIEKYVETNVRGTAILLDILTNKKNRVKKIVISESRAIYGEGKYNCNNCGIVYPESRTKDSMLNGDFNVKCPKCGENVFLIATDEDSLPKATSVYGITKQVSEQLVHCVCKAIDIPSISLRYQNVYGPGQSLKNPYTGIISIFSNELRQNHTIEIFEDGNESRDFVYIDDVVEATVLAIDNEICKYQNLNIGSGISTSVYSIANKLKLCLQSESQIIINGRFRLGDIRSNYADITKAKSLLKYIPKINVDSGLKMFCEWVLTQQIEKIDTKIPLIEMQEKGLYR